MINESIKRQKKLDKLIELTEITDEELDKLNYKEKQRYYDAKRKLGKLVFVSKDKNGKGVTYRKKNKKK